MNRAALDALAESRAWARGDLGHMLSRRQRKLIARWRTHRPKRFVINWSRRAGKTRALCTLAVEECLRNPKSRVLYVAPTQDMARAIVMAEMRELLEGPGGPRLAYTFSVQALRWTFPNGSTIKLGGCDGLNANRLRGGTA